MANTAKIIIQLIDKASNVFKKIGSNSQQMADTIRKNSSSIQTLGVQFAAIGVAGVAAFALVTKAAADSEEALRRTMTMTGLQGDAYNKMFKSLDQYASELAVQFGVAGEIINNAFYQVLSTGAAAGSKDFKALTEVALRLNKVVGLDLSDAVEQTAGTLRTFGMKLSDAGKMSDIFFKASRLGATTVPQLYEAMKQAGPIANAMGLSLEETTAILTHFANQNIKGGEAGNMFRRVLVRITSPTKEARMAMEKLGITIFDSAGKMRKFPDILKDFKVALSKLTEEQKASAVKAIAGQYAMAGFLKAVNSNIDQIPKFTKELGNARGETEKAEAGMRLGFNETLKRMGQIVNETFKVIGKVVTEHLKPYMKAIEKAAKAMLKWVKDNPEIVKIAIAIAAVGTALAIVLGVVLVAVGTFGLFVASIITAAPVLLIIGKALLVLTPIIATVIAIATALYVAWQTNFLGIQDIVQSVITFVKKLWNGLLEFFNQIILPFFDLLREKFWKIWDAVKEVWDEAMKSILPILEDFWNDVQKTFDKMKPYLEEFWRKFKLGWHKILIFVSPIIDKMIEIFKKDLMKFIQDKLVPALIVAFDLIKKAFKVLSWIAINIVFPFIDAIIMTGKDIKRFVGIWHDNFKKEINRIKKLLFEFKVWYDMNFAGMGAEVQAWFTGGGKTTFGATKGKEGAGKDDVSGGGKGIEFATIGYRKLKEAIVKTGESVVLLASQQKGLNEIQTIGNLLQNALTTSSGEFVEAGEKVTAEIGSMVQGLTFANAGQSAWNRHLFNSMGIFDNSKTSLLDYKLEVEGLKEQIDLSKMATSLFNKSTEKAGKAVKYTYDQLDKSSIKFAGHKEKTEKATEAIVGFGVKIDELKEPIERSGEKLVEQRKKIVGLYEPLVTIGKTFTWLGETIKKAMEGAAIYFKKSTLSMISDIKILYTSMVSMISMIKEAIKEMANFQEQASNMPSTGGETGATPGKRSIVSISKARQSMIAAKEPVTINLHVGTLVADDTGLRKLSDVLHKFNLERQGRRA